MILYIIFSAIAVVFFTWRLSTKSGLSKQEKEVIQGCIKHYEDVIQIAEVTDDWYMLMHTNGVHGGLCYYLDIKGIPPKLKKWIKKVPNIYYKFWFRPPMRCYNRHGAIEALQYRVDKMKQLLEKY